VEAGESLDEALERELREELGLETEAGRELGRVRWGRAELVFLEVRAAEFDQLPRHHYPEVAFVSRKAAAAYDLLEADRRFLQMQGG
jgi:ADP-ribose pyrophosphatase YjhB (NUDIX family)